MKKFLSIFLIAILMFSSLPSMLTKAESKNKGTLTIHKFEQDPFNGPLVQGNGTTNVQIPKNAKPLAGVTFEIKQVASFEKFQMTEKLQKKM